MPKIIDTKNGGVAITGLEEKPRRLRAGGGWLSSTPALIHTTLNLDWWPDEGRQGRFVFSLSSPNGEVQFSLSRGSAELLADQIVAAATPLAPNPKPRKRKKRGK